MVVPLIRRLTLGIALAGTVAGASQPPDLRTRAETSDYAETSRYDDVMRVTRGIAESRALARVETFGRSEEGRELPLLVLANPAIASPDAARRLRRPIVFIQANIHGGEVEGKEASLQLARRLTTGDLQPLLGDLVVADRARSTTPMATSGSAWRTGRRRTARSAASARARTPAAWTSTATT